MPSTRSPASSTKSRGPLPPAMLEHFYYLIFLASLITLTPLAPLQYYRIRGFPPPSVHGPFPSSREGLRPSEWDTTSPTPSPSRVEPHKGPLYPLSSPRYTPHPFWKPRNLGDTPTSPYTLMMVPSTLSPPPSRPPLSPPKSNMRLSSPSYTKMAYKLMPQRPN